MAAPHRRLIAAAALAAGLALAALGAQQARRTGPPPAPRAVPGELRMISSETCTVCAIARGWFQARHLPYSECLIERDPACRREFEAGGWSGTPVIRVRGKVLLGFSPPLVQDALAGRG